MLPQLIAAFAKNQRLLSLIRSVIVSVGGIIYVACPVFVLGQNDNSGQNWRVGKELDLYVKSGFSATMSEAELGPRLRKFAAEQRVGVVIDRRVDPSLKINLGIQNGSMEQFFWGIAQQHELGVCRVGDFYYLAPKNVAATLPLAWKQLKKADATTRSESKVAWTDRARFASTKVVEPKRILSGLASEYGFKIENLETIPYDLWSPFEVPPTTLEGRVAILVVGFGKWFERSADGTTIKIIDFPEIKNGVVKIGVMKDARQLAKRMKARFSQLTISAQGKTITASGPPNALAELKAAIVKTQTPPVEPSTERPFSLNTTASRGSILAAIAIQIGRKFSYEKPAPKALREQIKISVKDLLIDDLVSEIVKGTDLKIEITESELIIRQVTDENFP